VVRTFILAVSGALTIKKTPGEGRAKRLLERDEEDIG